MIVKYERVLWGIFALNFFTAVDLWKINLINILSYYNTQDE